MRVAIVSYGPMGDVIPFQALAMKLLSSGHQVKVCTHDIFQNRFENAGAEFVAIGPPFDRDYYNETLDLILEIHNPLKSLVFLNERGILKDAQQWYTDCLKALPGVDLAIIHAVDIPAQEAATHLNIPWITANFFPGGLKTSYEAPVPFPSLAKPLNCFFWKVTEWLCQWKYDPPFNAFISSVGGTLRPDIAMRTTYSQDLHLLAASPSLCGDYPDRPSNIRFTGAWFLDEEEYPIPSDLQEFLSEGEPPIVISFSSVGGTHGEESAHLLLKTIQDMNHRFVIQKGWLEMTTETKNPNIFFCPYVPHAYLFPRSSLIIHHGGRGTSQRACKEGVPSIVIPHLSDEHYWARLLYEKGVAPPEVKRQHLSPEKLKNFIEKTFSSETYHKNALLLKESLSQENGLNTALKLIEEHALQKGIIKHANI